MEKEITQIMKGLAILSIALHNFLHIEKYGFTKENEMGFDMSNTYNFFNHILNPTPALLFDYLSFMGWFGVPVFVFLSGYGLSKKYENKSISITNYIKHSYIKLLILILPATLFFILYQGYLGLWKRVILSLFSLTFLNGLFNLPSSSPTFWYFSLTFQLYVLYLILYRIKKYYHILIIILCLLVQAFVHYTCNNSDVLSYIRHNFIGWLPFFVPAILLARNKIILHPPRNKIGVYIVLSFMLLILTILMNLNFILWLIMPFFSVLLFFYISCVIVSNSKTKKIGTVLGNYSPFIFVSHPIALTLINEMGLEQNVLAQTFLYVLLFSAITLIYKKVDNYIINKVTY